MFLFAAVSLQAQQQQITKPQYVIVTNDSIISEEELGSFMQKGFVKSMNKGVSQEVRDELAIKLGDKIGEKEFVIIVELFTQEEKLKQALDNSKPSVSKEENELILNVGDKAYNFTVEMIDGTTITLSDLKGKVVLLNFWATWCGPCLMEFHEIPAKIIDRFEGEDFVFVPISRGESADKVKAKMQQLNKKGIIFNVGIDPDKIIWNEFATKSIPKNFIIDKDGVIRYISTGNSEGSVDKLADEIKLLLENN